MNRNEVLIGIQTQLQKFELKDLQEKLRESFFDMDNVIKYLYKTLMAGKNIILYGPGGFGKSTIVVEFLKLIDINYSTIVGYEDMDVEGLLGIPDMDKLLNKSIYETAFDRTPFANPGILILEEFLDVNPKTAIALKDILTAGGLRQGQVIKESLISSVIICSNKSPYELSVDSSTDAFYKERFPIVCEVKWNSYSYINYLAFIKTITTKEEYEAHTDIYTVIAELAYRTSLNTIISPRIVKDSVEFVQLNDYNIYDLVLIDGFDTDILTEVKLACEIREEKDKLSQIKYNINTRLNEILTVSDMSSRYITDSIIEINAILRRLEEEEEVTNADNTTIFIDTIMKCKDSITILWGKFDFSEAVIIKKLFDI